MTVGAAGGRLLVLEGAEGVGKSTQLARLVERLARAGIAHLPVREPGGTAVGDEIRRLLLHAEHDIAPAAEALLFMASRAELVERVVRPALNAGRLVIADRFFLSTYAYQVAGRGLPEEAVRAANRFATGGLVPDLTLLLELPVEVGLGRAGARASAPGIAGLDRIEASGADFHRRVGSAFSAFASPSWQRAHPECGPIVAVDASGDADEVAARVWRAVEERWPETFRVPTESHLA